MGERDPLISAALGIIPGLGQVYTGKTLLGIVVFFITIIAFLAILWFGVLIWALSIFYAWHTAKRISTGEIQFSEPGNKEYLIFIAGIVVTCVICVVINLIFLVLLFSGSNTGFISSSGYRSNYNVSIVVGKNGTLITLYNSEIEPYENIIVGGGKEPYCSGGGISCPISKRYTTTINGIETKKCWVIGPLCEVYGTTGKDHIVVESDIGTYEGNYYHGSFETYVGCNATLEGEVACEATGLCIAGDKTCNESKIYTQYAKAQTMTGLALADSGNMAGALASLNRAIAIDPTQSDAWEVRGIVHARSGKITDSQADFEMAVTLLENSSPYWYNLGVSRSLLGNRSGAVDAYGHALLLDKNLTNSQLMIIGKAFIALGQYGAAIRIFENVNEKEFAIESMQERGIALAVLGRYNESSSAFDAAIDANPLNIPLGGLGRWNKSNSALDAAIDTNPLIIADIWSRVCNETTGKCEHLIGNDQKSDPGLNILALEQIDDQLNSRQNDSDLWMRRGKILIDLKRYDEAITSFESSISIEPDNAEALNWKGVALFYMGENSLALAAFDQAMTLRPDFIKPRNNKAFVLMKQERYEQAALAYQEALNLSRKNAEPDNAGDFIRVTI